MSEQLPEVVDLKPINERLKRMAEIYSTLLERIEDIDAKIEEPRLRLIRTVQPTQSDTIGKLALALSKAQKAMGLVSKTGEVGRGNSKSADLADLLVVAVPALEANELSVTYGVGYNEYGEETLKMTLIHSSGEWISSVAFLRADDTMKNEQEFQKRRGGAITYLMKNMYRAMLCLGAE